MKNKKQYNDTKVVSTGLKREEAFWLKKFSGEFERTDFPYDYPLAPGITDTQDEYKSVMVKLPAAAYSMLTRISSGSRKRLHMILIAGLIVLLQKYTGLDTIVLGMPIYRQDVDENDETRFVNTILALKNRVDVAKSFKDLILQVRQTISEAVKHVNYPMERLLFRLNQSTEEKQDFPLFGTACLLENIHHEKDLRNCAPDMLFVFKVDDDKAITGLRSPHQGLQVDSGVIAEALCRLRWTGVGRRIGGR